MWVERDWSEKYDDRFPEDVGRLHRHVKGWIVDAALGTLHPVDDTGTVSVGRSCASDARPRVMREFGQVVHEIGISKYTIYQSEAGDVLADSENLNKRRGSLTRWKTWSHQFSSLGKPAL